jgi:spermidine synthase
MVSAFLGLVRLGILLALLFPVCLTAYGRLLIPGPEASRLFWPALLGAGLGALGLFAALRALLGRAQPAIEALSLAQAEALDRIPESRVGPAILASAAVSLCLELAMIRWQGAVWELFALYKNFGLLSCFLGLGLGYALSGRAALPLLLTAPLLAFQAAWSIALRHSLSPASLRVLTLPLIPEQLNIGLPIATSVLEQLGVYLFLSVSMLLTALTFVPVGQLCGRLLDRTRPLRAYGLNLLGSLVGVALMFAASLLWTPPILWFAPCLCVLVYFQLFDRRATLAAVAGSLVFIGALAWPVSFGWEQIYSPYQFLERGRGSRGLMLIRAAGHYYQRVHDLSSEAQALYPDRRTMAAYYELPYAFRPAPARVAIVGAGTGNDVAAALRRGAGHADAIEIDPAILELGVLYHPERPYDSPRVTRVVDDARTFLRSTRQTYDLIVYGLLDSHTLLSHASGVRLDSFVYTVEGLREARAHLTENGVISLSFTIMSRQMGRKIYRMMEQAFDGHPPICISTAYDRSVVFAQSRQGNLRPDPAHLRQAGFEDLSTYFANPALRADVSTDDWPFFYMPERVFPVSYAYMVALVLGVSLALFGRFSRERPRLSHAAYFLLGAGFMLVETKAITELGLVFGNTWQIIGIVIAAILGMAFCANLLVLALRIQDPLVPYLLLLGSLGVGLVVARGGGLAAEPGSQLAAVILLTCPMLFSGIVFSTLLAGTSEASGPLAMNILGAMVGGLLEYTAMYFGFQFLYGIAMELYGAALAAHLVRRLHTTR